MSHPPVLPSIPVSVYLEANPLVDWMNPSNRRLNLEAGKLIGICARHKSSLEVVTSQWALTEAHGTLYKLALQANGFLGKDPRKGLFPPHQLSLQTATADLTRGMQRLGRLVNLRVDQPGEQTWLLALQISEECGIYPPDCLHLATALVSHCDLFVTQDADFINAVHHFLSSTITKILSTLYHTPPTFDACPLVPSSRIHRPNPTALAYLKDRGYT